MSEETEHYLKHGSFDGLAQKRIDRNDRRWFVVIILITIAFSYVYQQRPNPIIIDNTAFFNHKLDSLQNYVDTTFGSMSHYKPEYK